MFLLLGQLVLSTVLLLWFQLDPPANIAEVLSVPVLAPTLLAVPNSANAVQDVPSQASVLPVGTDPACILPPNNKALVCVPVDPTPSL
jgi:hypothetical protein